MPTGKIKKNQLNFFIKNDIEIVYGKSSHSFPVHSHNSFCIGGVTEGAVWFQIDQEKELLEQPMAYLIPSNIGVEITPEKEYQYFTICLGGRWKEYFGNTHFSSYFFRQTSNFELLDLCEQFEQDGDDNAFVQALIQIMEQSGNMTYLKKTQSVTPIIQDACNYLKNHVEDKFSLDLLSEAVAVSKYYLTRKFKAEMGVTPAQYHLQEKLRMLRAETNLQKEEIDLAMQLHFSDQSHLCNAFKKNMGISIKEYKHNIIRK